MSELTKFECDVSGDWYSARNDVIEFEVRRNIRSPFEVSKRTVHISEDVIAEEDLIPPTRLKYVGVEEGEVVGAAIGYNPYHDNVYYEYEERGDYMIKHYEAFFEFIEENILY